MNHPQSREAGSLQAFFHDKDTFDKNNVWVRIPAKGALDVSHFSLNFKLTILSVSFIVNADPEAEADPEKPEATPMYQMGILENPFASLKTTTSDPPPSRASIHPNGSDNSSATASIEGPASTPPIPPSVPLEASDPSTHTSDTLSAQGATAIRSAMSSPSNMITSNNHHLNHVLNAASAGLSPSLQSPLESLELPACTSSPEPDVESEHEVAFLLRHFSEGPGQWMDLYDLNSYFANYVPVKAVTNPLLRFAATSYAAKHLSRVEGRKQVMGGYASQQGYSELWPNITKVDWGNKAAQYYDKAINILIEALKDGAVGVGPTVTPEGQLEYGNSTSARKRKGFHASTPSDSSTSSSMERSKKRKISAGPSLSDEMAAATAILCNYELLHDAGLDWIRHLDGTKSLLDRVSLFDIVEGSMMPLQPQELMPRPRISRARQATFWNFARQDFLSALITEKQTRLDTEDLPMWKDAGISVDGNGFIKPSNLADNGLPEGDSMKEDMTCNALIWIMSKIVNFAVAGEVGPAQGGEEWEEVNQAALSEKWLQLDKQLETWHAGLPDTFKPCAEIPPRNSSTEASKADESPVFTEIWYNMPMCASTMQSYHMARMLLLLNQPPLPTVGRNTFYRRLDSCKTIASDILYHARAICGIAISRPHSAARIHSVQPLFIAAQSLDRTVERKSIIRLLRAIEHDTGWATAYRVRQLLEVWNWPEELDKVK